MIELQADYIKKHMVENPRTVELCIVAEEDYSPDTDGYHCDILSFSSPLSMPQDNSGTSDIERIMFYLIERIEPHELTPNTEYRVTMVECAEYDGGPGLMATWAVQKVVTFDLGMHIIVGAA